EDLVMRLLAGNGVWERRHRHHPQAPAGVKGHLDRILEIGKLLLGGKEIQGVAVRHFQIMLLLGRHF
ncbi:MAG: hypothetical protein ACK56I_13065, partial [bacterium]